MRCRHAAAAVLLATALAMAVQPGQALATPSGTVTRAEFVSAVERSLASVRRVRAGGDASGAATLASEIASGVLAPAAVDAGGRMFEPDRATLERLVRKLREAGSAAARRDALADIESNLASMRGALGSPAAAPPSDPKALSALLAERAPSGTSAAATNDWLGEQLRALVQRFAVWLNSMGGTGRDIGGAWFYGVLAVAGVGALLLIGRGVIAWRRGTASRDDRTGVRGSESPVVAAAQDIPDDVVGFAERLAADGRRRDAVRALYGGAARSLVEAGAVRRVRTRTNAELLRDVRSSAPAAAEALAGLIERFESAWYGHADPGDDGYRAARASFFALTAAVERSGGGTEAGERR